MRLFLGILCVEDHAGFQDRDGAEAVAFSFEMAPRYCFEANGQGLLFGSHAWAKYDREFLRPFLLKWAKRTGVF